MTAYVPANVQPMREAAIHSRGIGNTLGWIAYLVLCVFVFDLPWGESIPMVGGIVFTNWIGLVAFAIAALRTLIVAQSRKPSAMHYWMLLLVGWSALSIFWTADWDNTVTRAGTYIQLLVMVWLIWELAVDEARVGGLLQAYVLGALFASGLTIHNFWIGRTAAELAAANGRQLWDTARYSVSGLNENDLGLILALSIPMAIYLLVSRKGALVKLLCWSQLLAGFTAILLTASRGSLLSAMVGMTMLPLSLPLLRRWQRIACIAACVGMLACGIYFVPQSSWSRIFQLGSEVSEGTMTHRTVIWAAGLEAFRNHAFLGVGSGAYGATVLRTIDIPYVAHNTFLSILVELGVIGFLLLLGLLASVAYRVLHMKYLERCLWTIVFLTWAVGVSALTWEYRKPTWLLFGLVAAHAYSRRSAGWGPRTGSAHRARIVD